MTKSKNISEMRNCILTIMYKSIYTFYPVSHDFFISEFIFSLCGFTLVELDTKRECVCQCVSCVGLVTCQGSHPVTAGIDSVRHMITHWDVVRGSTQVCSSVGVVKNAMGFLRVCISVGWRSVKTNLETSLAAHMSLLCNMTHEFGTHLRSITLVGFYFEIS